MNRMRKILISAYGCEPNAGSEQGVGWNWVLQMAKNNKLFVITRANNRERIEGSVPQEVESNITFYYYDTPKIVRNLKNKAKGLYIYYFFWQIGILSLAKKIIKDKKPNYSMHLTFGSMWMPTFLPLLKTPFIWGPIGGGECVPKSFIKKFNFKDRVIQSTRYILNATTSINPLTVLPIYKSVAILCRTNNTSDAIRSKNKKHTILETAMEQFFDNGNRLNNQQYIKIITTGRLVAFKNIICTISALASQQLKETNFKYYIIGSGPEKKRIQARIKELSLENKIFIIDQISRNEVIQHLSTSNIFLFPSLREGGSWALMEAMQAGLPVVCLNWSGMQIITDDNCAIRLSVTNPEQMAKDMADAIVKLANNPDLRERMGKAGRERIKNEFNWEAKGEFMEQLFDKLDNEKNINE